MKKVFLGFITLVLTLSFFVLSCTTEVIYQESESSSGSSNTGIVWKGSFESADELGNPEYLWAFYNTTDGCSYIYDGEKWTLLASGGTGAGSARTYIRYELNGGNLSDDAPFIYTYGTTLELVEPSYEPYTFEGFYYESDFSGEKITKLDSTHVIGAPLYAKWSYSITYEYKDGRTPYTETIYDINSPYTLSLPDDESTRWYDEEGHRVTDPTYNTETKKGDTVFYIYPTYTITYVLDGYENDERNVTLYTELDDVVLYNAKVNDSHSESFWGWYLSPDYDETTYIAGWKAGEHPESGNICIYARVTSQNIRGMETSGTVEYRDILSDSDLNQIVSDLKDLYSRKPDIKVNVDLSRATGLTEIGERTFEGCENLRKISIPNSVTSIEYRTFANCSSLESISIPNTVTSIGQGTFSCCSSLKSISIPDSVTSIGESAFACCSSLESISIPNSVTSIGESAFACCSSLESISIPNSVTSIGEDAFIYCTSLKSISIPNSITSIEYRAFGECSSLESIYIPNSVTSIGTYAFAYCSSLESISIPDSVTSIGESAFAYCSSLESISIPNSVTSIESNAFNGCSSLKSISIPNSVTSIGYSAFGNCTSLKSISIPDSVTSIGESAFAGCSSLEDINISESHPSYRCIDGVLYHYASDKLELVVFPETKQSSLTTFAIPNGVTSIGEDAFSRCSNLKSISIPNSVTSIGKYAFADCSSLESISIPDSVTSIDYYAFEGCYSLKSVIFGNTNGWKAGDTALNSSELASPATAASYLTVEYRWKDWTRED